MLVPEYLMPFVSTFLMAETNLVVLALVIERPSRVGFMPA